MNLAKLQGHVPATVFAHLQELVTKFQINTNDRMAHFLGQCDHESLAFTHTQEDLNYSAAGLLATFPKYFSSLAAAKIYERQPTKIANHVYASRLGNGNEASGDGWKHRGMGYIQLTGKTNQDGFFKSMGLSLASDPTLIATQYPLASAAYFWNLNNLNKLADGGVTTPVITSITKVINGGTNGIDNRIKDTLKYAGFLK